MFAVRQGARIFTSLMTLVAAAGRQVEADEGFATLRFREMECIGEIHPAPRPVQYLRSRGGVFQCNARQTGEGGESGNNALAAKPITAAQQPFGFE
jgi:hypothetical protein